MKLTWRLTNILGFLLTIGLIAFALLMQYKDHLSPCPLCIMQRIAFFAIAAVFFIFMLLPKKDALIKAQAILMFLASGSGFGIAARQLYLQHLPEGMAPACGPGLNYLLNNFPWHQALAMVLQGSGECAVVDWRFLGLSMAGWAAIWFAIFIIWAITLLFKKLN